MSRHHPGCWAPGTGPFHNKGKQGCHPDCPLLARSIENGGSTDRDPRTSMERTRGSTLKRSRWSPMSRETPNKDQGGVEPCERCEGDGAYYEMADCTTCGKDCACNGPRVLTICDDCSAGYYLRGREEAREGEDRLLARAEAAEKALTEEKERVETLQEIANAFQAERDEADERVEGLGREIERTEKEREIAANTIAFAEREGHRREAAVWVAASLARSEFVRRLQSLLATSTPGSGEER